MLVGLLRLGDDCRLFGGVVVIIVCDVLQGRFWQGAWIG